MGSEEWGESRLRIRGKGKGGLLVGSGLGMWGRSLLRRKASLVCGVEGKQLALWSFRDCFELRALMYREGEREESGVVGRLGGGHGSGLGIKHARQLSDSETVM